MNFLYRCIIYFAFPFILRRYWRERLPHHRFLERFGRITNYRSQRVIWIHAASVGEVITVAPVIYALLTDHPQHCLVITCMTAAGIKHAEKLFPNKIKTHFLPIDLKWPAHRFIKRLRPELCIIVETELWPNLITAAAHALVPIVLINARLSAKSFAFYSKIPHFTQRILQNFNWIAAKSREDAQRFRALGIRAQRINVLGSLKFDVFVSEELTQMAQQLRQQIGRRPVWIAASTHANEEEIMLAAHRMLLTHFPEALLILVPRHPQRFKNVSALCQKLLTSSAFVLRSEKKLPTMATQVYLADSLGELMLLYGIADVAFVGGSIAPIGGHNLMEPAIWQLPIITGPHLDHVKEMVDLLEDVRALTIINSAQQLAQILKMFFENPQQRHTQGKEAWQVVQAHRGVQRRINQQLNGFIPLEGVNQLHNS